MVAGGLPCEVFPLTFSEAVLVDGVREGGEFRWVLRAGWGRGVEVGGVGRGVHVVIFPLELFYSGRLEG